MINPFAPAMAAKSDLELQVITQQKHRYEPEAYVAAIEELERRQLATAELLAEKNDVIASLNESPIADQEQSEERASWTDALALFKISKEYFYTPIIIYTNVLIWLLMIGTGVHALSPSVESLLNWGGNLSALTLSNEPWRLLTSTLLHGGIIHLLLNMLALLRVGAILEMSLGRHRYALIYLVTGIFASLASAAFSENVVSVGASGAIFGLYGLFLSLLISKSIDLPSETRENFIVSTLIFIGYNVFYGFAKTGIDNAAHIGGLLAGFVIGFLYYPTIRQPKLSAAISGALVVVTLVAVWAAPSLIRNKYAEFDSAMRSFAANQERTMWMAQEDFPTPGTAGANIFRERLRFEGINLWNENLALLNSLEEMPSELQGRIDLMKTYCKLRIESCETMLVLTEREDEEQTNRLIEINRQIEDLINKLNGA